MLPCRPGQRWLHGECLADEMPRGRNALRMYLLFPSRIRVRRKRGEAGSGKWAGLTGLRAYERRVRATTRKDDDRVRKMYGRGPLCLHGPAVGRSTSDMKRPSPSANGGVPRLVRAAIGLSYPCHSPMHPRALPFVTFVTPCLA